ncbi:hypothetical protein QZH41_002830 [Actinostola sp. cb2023]|nr:hypothetical protein QZH41_002830 [Actinostola sp. cb2023]
MEDEEPSEEPRKNQATRQANQFKYSEIGSMALARNRNEGLRLSRSLDCYDKQRIKAARSIELAQRSLKNNLKTLSSKLGDGGQLEDAKLRRLRRENRRQSSPAPLSLATSSQNSIEFAAKGGSLQGSELEMPLGSKARNFIHLNRLVLHRHSLPSGECSSLKVFQTTRTNSSLSLKPGNVNNTMKYELKSASWSNLGETLNTEQNLHKSKSVSCNLPKIDIEKERKTLKKSKTTELFHSQSSKNFNTLMAEASPKVGNLWEKASFPEGVPKSPWNFNIYVMYAVIKHIVRGSFKSSWDAVLQNSSQCQTNMMLGEIDYLQLEDCFLTNQKYSEPLQVGSVSEDVSIVQIFRQACEDTPKDGNMENLHADLSFECDFNLCFQDITADEFLSTDMALQLHVIPSSLPGQAQLVVPPNVDCSAVPGLSQLCVQDDQGLTLLSSELLVNEMYSILTVTTAIMNVVKCQNQAENSGQCDENESAYATSLQYVGQAGPAVHIVTCIVVGKTNRKHLYLTEDVSISVPCRKWPSCARKWSLRARPSGWPSRELIDQVFQGGCHLVPKYDPSGGNDAATSEGAACSDATPKTQWRYSFSLPEKLLMKSITDDQKMCYLIFKYLFAWCVKLESVITTYTAKTLFLWELETVPADQWCFSMIGDRVKNLVEKLRSCVENKYCQHYFIDGCNTLQQMDDRSRRVTLDNGFAMLDEEMAGGPDLETGTLTATSDFPFHFMTTYKSFYPINVWLEALSAQMKSKLDPPNEVPSGQNIQDFLDNTKVQPIQMPEILIHLALADKVYGEPLPVPQSLLQQQKVTQVVEFLKRSTTAAKFEECMKDLDVELKFLHLQYKIIEEIEQFLKDNPTFVHSFENSSDESETEGNAN